MGHASEGEGVEDLPLRKLSFSTFLPIGICTIFVFDVLIFDIFTFRHFCFRLYEGESWKVTLSDNASEWQHGICNCPSFFKEYICKHIVGMSIRLKFCRPPSAAKDIPLGEKRK